MGSRLIGTIVSDATRRRPPNACSPVRGTGSAACCVADSPSRSFRRALLRSARRLGAAAGYLEDDSLPRLLRPRCSRRQTGRYALFTRQRQAATRHWPQRREATDWRLDVQRTQHRERFFVSYRLRERPVRERTVAVSKSFRRPGACPRTPRPGASCEEICRATACWRPSGIARISEDCSHFV